MVKPIKGYDYIFVAIFPLRGTMASLFYLLPNIKQVLYETIAFISKNVFEETTRFDLFLVSVAK